MTFEPSLGYFLPFFWCWYTSCPAFQITERRACRGATFLTVEEIKKTGEGLFFISQFKFESVMKNSSIFSKTLNLKPNLILMVKGTSFKFIRDIYYVDNQNRVKVLRVNSK